MNGSTAQTPYVICVGTAAEETAAIARALHGQAVVLAVSDAGALRPLLGGGPEAVRSPATGGATATSSLVREGALTIDRRLRQVTWDGAIVAVSPREFDLLALLAGDTGRVWTFQDIMSTVWRVSYLGDADMVLSTVKRLRRRLASATQDVQVRSVRGVGFRLVVRPAAGHCDPALDGRIAV